MLPAAPLDRKSFKLRERKHEVVTKHTNMYSYTQIHTYPQTHSHTQTQIHTQGYAYIRIYTSIFLYCPQSAKHLSGKTNKDNAGSHHVYTLKQNILFPIGPGGILKWKGIPRNTGLQFGK